MKSFISTARKRVSTTELVKSKRKLKSEKPRNTKGVRAKMQKKDTARKMINVKVSIPEFESFKRKSLRTSNGNVSKMIRDAVRSFNPPKSSDDFY